MLASCIITSMSGHGLHTIWDNGNLRVVTQAPVLHQHHLAAIFYGQAQVPNLSLNKSEPQTSLYISLRRAGDFILCEAQRSSISTEQQLREKIVHNEENYKNWLWLNLILLLGNDCRREGGLKSTKMELDHLIKWRLNMNRITVA